MSGLFESGKKASKKVLNHCKSSLFPPSKFVSSCCGIGYLPVWGGHWASFLSTSIVFLIIYIGSPNFNSLVSMSAILLKASLIGIVIDIITTHIFLSKDKEAGDHTVFSALVGQMLLFATAGPGLIYVADYFGSFLRWGCGTYFYCAPWFYEFGAFFPIFTVGFAIFRFVDTLKPWPASYLDIHFNNALSNSVESLISSIYSCIITYLIAFMITSLTPLQVSNFYKAMKYEVFAVGEAKYRVIGDMDPLELALKEIPK